VLKTDVETPPSVSILLTAPEWAQTGRRTNIARHQLSAGSSRVDPSWSEHAHCILWDGSEFREDRAARSGLLEPRRA
jgi:hypothetical protein